MPTSPEQPTSVGAVIKDGRFALPAEEGPVPGLYKVAIYAEGDAAPLPEGHVPGVPLPAPQDLIPPKYNVATELTADVKKGGPNKFEFPLSR